MSAARASKGARSAWDEEPTGVSDRVAVRPSRRTDGVLRRRLLLVPRRAGGGIDDGRRGTTRTPADGSCLGDAGSDGGPALGAGPTSVRHGCNGRRRTERWKTDSGAPLPARQMSDSRVPADP